ncbi:serine O-acetyltransferase [Klebsiella pneumoniae]|nr:serine acetyltransferase [Klebsiella pneumoniae]HBU8981112.1 serine acetyltransferase [Klebsiella pneumoniae]
MKFKYLLRGCYLLITKFFKIVYCMLYFNDGRVALYSELTIGLKTLKEFRTKLPHPFGVVIGKGVTIGYDCKFYQGVTIGAKLEDGVSYPVLGNNVTIYANSVVVGDVKIGNNVVIGASSLVLKDVPDNSIVAGNPAKIISTNNAFNE